MTGKRALITCLSLVLCLAGLPLLAQEGPVASVWAAAPPAIDGRDADWQDVQLLKDPVSGAQYAVKNDGRNLYLMFFFSDPAARSTVDATGIYVYYTLDGKRSKDLGVHFVRKDLSANELIKSLEKDGEVLTEQQKAEMRKNPSYIVFMADTINKRKLPSPKDPSAKTEKPAFRFAPKERAVVFEFRIPLSRVNHPAGIGAQPGQKITLGFEWGGMTREMIAAQMARRAEQSTQAASRAGSMESALNEGDERVDVKEGPSDYRPDKRAKKHSFWVDVTLATGGQ
jgi:hypothetical protein